MAVIVGSRILPLPAAVVLSIVDDWQVLLVHFAYSACRVLVSIAAGVVVAVPVATALGMWRALDRAMFPLVYALYATPKIVFLPLIVVALGVGELSKLTVVALVVGFQMIVPIRDAVRRIPEEQLTIMRQLAATPLQTWRYLVLPAAMPAVATSLRLAVGTALAVLYIAEFTASSRGLGYYVSLNATVLLDYPAVYAGAILLGVLGVTLVAAVARVERRYLRPETRPWV